MTYPLIQGLSRYAKLTSEDCLALVKTPGQRVQRFESGQDLVQKGDYASSAYLVLEGWAYRYKILANGRRQIISYLLPGDISDLNLFATPRLDHSIGCLTAVTVMELPHASFEMFFNGSHPRIAEAFWAKMQTAASIQREWTVNLGQRSAPERLGHLLCELFHRLRMAGQTDNNQCSVPLTQSDLAEATGLSLVHVNKRIQDLRSAGLIVFRGKVLTIPNLEALEKASLFSADYLNVHDPVASGSIAALV